MANDDRRKYDDKIDEIYKLLTEMRGTQIEMRSFQDKVAEPTFLEIKNTLYDRGGVCETIHSHTCEIKEISNRIDKFPTIMGWILGGVSVGAGILLWIYETVQKISPGGAR